MWSPAMAMAMSPVRDRCDLNGNATSASSSAASAGATSATSSPRKTKKTIINWLVNGSRAATASASASATDSDNNNRQSVRDNPTLDDNQNPNQNPNQNQSCNCESRAFRDFRGVQTLRLLWSKRIKSASEDQTVASTSSSSRASSLGTLRKLNKSVSCLVNAFNNPSPEKSLAKRAASLHNLQDAALQQQQLQREKDNFYKYKNAEQARMRGKLRRSSDEPTVINAHKNACASVIKNARTTLVASKCDDSMPPLPPASIECNMESPVPRRLPDSVISDMEVGGKQAEQADEEEEEVELRATPARSRARARVRVSLSAASAQSGGSSESEHTTSTQTSSTVTSTATRAVTKRKYSFKTHAGRSYVQHHTPRRISSSCSNSGGGGGGMGQATDVPTGSSSSTNSLVAKLTQQFNEIIQKDARVLEQVKRKKGVWLARGSHVYKIVEKQPAAMQPPPENGISTVQRNIKKFETLEKPSVPQKSEQLRHLAAATGSNRSNNLTLKTKRSLKGTAAELEVVCEEAKTPVELEPATEEKATKEEPPAAEQQQQPPMETEEDDLKPELELDEERQKQRKHKYASIYEKLRFTFAGRSRKSASPSPTKAAAPEMALQMVTEMAPEEMETKLEEEPQQTGANSPLMLGQCIEADADSKILDALEVLDQKIKGISAHSEAGELLLGTNDDFEQRLLPNTSFVYQAANKQISNNQLLVNQAVNVTLVNAIEGEQMIMEQKQLMKAENEKKNEEQQEEQVAVREEPKELPAEEEPESIYEPITPSALPAIEPKTEAHASSLFKIVDIQKSEIIEDIYQTVEEASASAAAACAKPNIWLEDYESIAGSCEATPPDFDGYESFAPPTPTANLEECLPMSTPSPGTHGGTLGRNTRDELPELPKPKRVLPKSPALLRPAPPKPDLAKDEDEDENIYDTIKGCYESMHTKVPASSGSGSGTTTTDAISLGSNCYESISHYRKTKTTATATASGHGTCIQLSSSGSTLTISSDHKTNSLYESSLAAAGCVVYGSASVGCRSSLGSGGSASSSGGGGKRAGDKRSSIAGSSDNSDAWVDISDGEGATAATAERLEAGPPPTEAQFVVVRERFKPHRTRSPDWSKRIRDKRLQQNKAISCIEDDSDHYYETLHSSQLQRQQDGARNGLRASHRRAKNHSVSAHALGEHVGISDDYDSFETDSDEHGEESPSQRLRNHNDSGVDMRNHRLPKPPAPQNQVYEFVRKFKDFISNKKSPKGSQQKLYENTTTGTAFYVESGKAPEEIYENTEYSAKALSSSEKTLNGFHSSEKTLNGSGGFHSPAEQPAVLRAKQKNGKSLRSRLRKSLVGSTFDSKQLSGLTATRSTFYLEDPELGPEPNSAGELDSGFSEKASSGDIPVQVPSAEAQKFSTVARKAKKEAKATRRRTTIGLRPHDPPPPPPPAPPFPGLKVDHGQGEQAGQPGQTTSWYAECGVFKQSNHLNGSPSQANDELATPTPSTHGGGGSSWYAESGLYQTSGISVASSSGSSGVSTGNEAGMGDDLQAEPHSMFSNEPLYQMYSAAKLESITRDLEAHESSADGYEEIGMHALRSPKPQPEPAHVEQLPKQRPSALQLVGPKNGPSRTLWSEIPEVIHSGILPTLKARERSLQEAKFEIITSEASYLKSLSLLRRHFMNNSAFVDSTVLSPRDRKALFSYIVPVHECSERLLTELECCWQDNIMLHGLSRCIYEIAERHFHVYIAFCEHQGRMDRTLRRLKEAKNGVFQQHLEKLEASPSCCGLNLHSFLMLPMQRITRLPLLIDAVFSKESPHNQEEYESWKRTLALVQKVVAQCNEAANRWEQAYELERISKQLEFPSHIRALAIAPVGVPKQGAKPRFLVKRGELTHLVWRGDDAKLTFGKRFTKSSIYAFLFSDLLVLCKRRGESSFSVFDYCPRSMLTIASGDTLPQLPTKDIKDQAGKNLILMTLLENCDRKTVELVLSCPSVSDQQRWLQAMRPPEAETPGEKLYESWDCPQVVAKHSYESDEPDVLNLELGDVVNVSRKLPDGWYQGERIRDGAVGWFPGSYTDELNSAHVRSRNLKQRHRLLTFTATYLEAQKGK